MTFEKGNIEELSAGNPNRKGWIVGNFIPEESLMHSDKCEVKWAHHPKGLKKEAGKELDQSIRTLVVLISGSWLTRFIESKEEVLLSTPGDYVIYEGAQHENEAFEDSHVLVVRWKK